MSKLLANLIAQSDDILIKFGTSDPRWNDFRAALEQAKEPEAAPQAANPGQRYSFAGGVVCADDKGPWVLHAQLSNCIQLDSRESSEQSRSPRECDLQLLKFYSAIDLHQLIDAQSEHIASLQATLSELRPLHDFSLRPVRIG